MTRTRDHSLSEQKLGKQGDDARAEVANRNVLFTCLGSPTKPVFSVNGPVNLMQGDRVMLCSDGLWSAVSEDDIVHHLSQKPVDAAVPDLVEQALRTAGSSSDNVTCLAFSWDTPDVDDASETLVTTEAVTGGYFASTVQLGWSESEAEAGELDDAAIERSIAEINDAIRRSSKKPG